MLIGQAWVTNGVGEWDQHLNHIEGRSVSGSSPKENHGVVIKIKGSTR